ncbi:Nuclear receptor domain-containing protein, partial [Trichostrongylus colubriformis]
MSQLSPESFSEEDATARRVVDHSAVDAPRICKVCGDRANGYNFGVLTCESCKAFFRRNAVREEEIKCPFSSNCEITSASRRFCQACRLQKCFMAGMSRSWLDDQKPRVNPRKRTANTEDE